MDIRYSELELNRFLGMLESKGLMKAPTARARKFATAKILSVLEPSEKSDLRKVNREEAVQRFVNKHSQDFHPDSLLTYQSRFNSALNDFIAYVENPMGFRPASAQRATRSGKSNSQPDATTEPIVTSNRLEPKVENPVSAAPGLITIPVPLPDGGMAQLYVPQKMTAADAERIAAVVKALAVGQPGGR